MANEPSDPQQIRLTQFSHGAGCGCKLGMSELRHALRHIAPVAGPNALVGHATGDAAAGYRPDDERALVVTTDSFTPSVDASFDFGRIAAANALSDIYAMGGRPLFVLNLVSFPRKLLGEGILETIL